MVFPLLFKMLYEKPGLAIWNYVGVSSFVVMWLAQNYYFFSPWPHYESVKPCTYTVVPQGSQASYSIVFMWGKKSVTKNNSLATLPPGIFFTVHIIFNVVSPSSGAFYPPPRLLFFPLLCRIFRSFQVLAHTPFNVHMSTQQNPTSIYLMRSTFLSRTWGCK